MATLADDMLAAGEHEVAFDGVALSAGIYFARLSTPSLRTTQKRVLLK